MSCIIVSVAGRMHGREKEEDQMATDAKSAQDKVKPLESKLPAKAPQYLQADYKTFKALADGFVNDLDALVKSVNGSATDRKDYPGKKKALADLKQKINDAASGQKSQVTALLKEIGAINKSASALLDTLKDKKAKEETDLSSAIFKFTGALQSISGLEAPEQVD